MPFFEFFRNLLGRGPAQELPQYRHEDEQQQYRNSFRNPIWQNDEDEDDISDFSSRTPRNRYQFRIFNEHPFEMTWFTGTQIDDIFRDFLNFGFGNNSSIFEHFGNDFSNALPMPDEQPRVKGPRDEVVKPFSDMPESNFGFGNFLRIFALPDKKSNDSPQVLDPCYKMPDPNIEKLDSDLDGKIKSNELAKFWKNPSGPSENFPGNQIHTSSKRVSLQTIVRSDGGIEKCSTVKDLDGNEETKIIRQMGDKMHIVVIKKAKDGSKIKSEDLVNMDENELKGFHEKWNNGRALPPNNCANLFSWHKFFGPNPKL